MEASAAYEDQLRQHPQLERERRQLRDITAQRVARRARRLTVYAEQQPGDGRAAA